MKKNIKYIIFFLFVTICLSKQDIIIKSPKPKEKLKIGNDYQIKWKTSKRISKDEKIKIFISYNSGNDWELISITENDGKYNWEVPQVNSNSCLLKIQSIDNKIKSLSKKEFKIDGPQIKILKPFKNNIYSGGEKLKIEWKSKKINNELINIYFSKDNGYTWEIIATNIVNFGIHTWDIPHLDDFYDECLIKIVSNTNNIISISEVFSIIDESNKIRISYPNGGELLEAGKAITIKWESDALKSELYKIMFSQNNGSTWERVESRVLNKNQYLWFCPNIESEDCLIKIIAVENEAIYDISEKKFKISKLPSLKIFNPLYNDIFYSENPIDIKWNSINVRGKKVNIYYSIDKGKKWNIIERGVKNNGIYNWDISEFNTTSSFSKIRVELSNNTRIIDETDGYFTIFGKPILNISSENKINFIEDNSNYKIEWKSKNIRENRLSLYYSVDNGKNWTTIEKDFLDQGFYNWKIPNLKTVNCFLKIQSTVQKDIYSISENPLNISDQPMIILKSDLSLNNYSIKDSINLSWKSYNLNDEYVDILYSENAGKDWKILYSNVKDIGYKKIEVPYVSRTSEKCKLKIIDSFNSKNYVVSSDFFSIKRPKGEITLKKISKTEFNYNENVTLKWSQKYLKDKKIRIFYSKNEGLDWDLIKEIDAKNEYFLWEIPNLESVSSKTLFDIKVLDADYEFLDKNKFFKINPAPSIQIDNITDTVKTNMPFKFTFKSKNINVKDFDLYYSLTKGFNWIKISENINSDSFLWNVPSIKGFSNALFKIEYNLDSEVQDIVKMSVLEQSINIKILEPNGGEEYYEDDSMPIVWSIKKIYDKTIDIYFSRDGGLSWDAIDLNVNNSGKYKWIIPKNINSDKCKIKVQSNINKSIFDVTDKYFSIKLKPSFKIITPNNGDILYRGTSTFIYWEAINPNIKNVTLSYSKDNGKTWTIIKENIINNGKYNWAIPKNLIKSNEYLIKVSSYKEKNKFDTSDKTFIIK